MELGRARPSSSKQTWKKTKKWVHAVFLIPKKIHKYICLFNRFQPVLGVFDIERGKFNIIEKILIYVFAVDNFKKSPQSEEKVRCESCSQVFQVWFQMGHGGQTSTLDQAIFQFNISLLQMPEELDRYY